MGDHPEMGGDRDLRDAVLSAALVGAACLATYELDTHLVFHVRFISRESGLIGAMWAVIATIFVFRWSVGESKSFAVSRIAATFLSAVLCLIYLSLFAFHPLGLAVVVAVGAILITLAGRPDAVITTGITTTVIMVVAAISPHDAWLQPILRFLDTLVGVAVGLAAAWVAERVLKPAPA